MRAILVAGLLVFATRCAAGGEVPKAAKTVLEDLQRLDAKTEAGVAYESYSKDVETLVGDFAVFAASDDGAKDAALMKLLGNAKEIHAGVSRLWNKSLFADKELDRYVSSKRLRHGRSIAWKTASLNMAYATKLLSAKADQHAAIEKAIAAEGEKLTLAWVAKEAEARLRKEVAEEDARDKAAADEAERNSPEARKKAIYEAARRAAELEAKATAEGIAKAKAAREADKEGNAARKLKIAKNLLESNPDAAKKRFAEIVEKFPGTAAAKEAQKFLGQGSDASENPPRD